MKLWYKAKVFSFFYSYEIYKHLFISMIYWSELLFQQLFVLSSLFKQNPTICIHIFQPLNNIIIINYLLFLLSLSLRLCQIWESLFCFSDISITLFIFYCHKPQFWLKKYFDMIDWISDSVVPTIYKLCRKSNYKAWLCTICGFCQMDRV